jgi:hypothetical protein
MGVDNGAGSAKTAGEVKSATIPATRTILKSKGAAKRAKKLTN